MMTFSRKWKSNHMKKRKKTKKAEGRALEKEATASRPLYLWDGKLVGLAIRERR